MKRLLVASACALVGSALIARAVDLSGTQSWSWIPNTPYRYMAPATPLGQLVGAAGAHTVVSALSYSKAASGAWLKIYDTATAPTCGSGTPIATVAIPAASTPANLAGDNALFGMAGVSVTNGIGICVTGDMGDSDTTALAANTVVVNLAYR